MIGLPSLNEMDRASEFRGVRIWLATAATDMRCGFDRLAALAQAATGEDPLSGQLFLFRGRSGDRTLQPLPQLVADAICDTARNHRLLREKHGSAQPFSPCLFKNFELCVQLCVTSSWQLVRNHSGTSPASVGISRTRRH